MPRRARPSGRAYTNRVRPRVGSRIEGGLDDARDAVEDVRRSPRRKNGVSEEQTCKAAEAIAAFGTRLVRVEIKLNLLIALGAC